jgi:nitrilase
MVVDAWGQVLNVLPEGAGVVQAELLPQDVAVRRAALPALTHRVL